MLVYVAGPYRADTKEGIAKNIQAAREVAIALWEAGHVAICPHLNTAHFEEDCSVDDEVYLNGDFEILRRCDACVMVGGWLTSVGARAEYAFCKDHDIPVFYHHGGPLSFGELPPANPTEASSPEQCHTFLNIVMALYRLHLSKNHDYSPANLQVTGEIGLVTRLWDKVARLLNLTGFRFAVSDAKYEVPKNPKHETIEDTLRDAAVYAIIGLILRAGAWGR